MKTIKLSYKNIVWFILGVCIIAGNYMPHSTVSDISLLAFFLAGGGYLLQFYRRLKANAILIAYILFFIWEILLAVMDLVLDSAAAWSTIRTMAINILFFFMVYNILLLSKDVRKIESLFFWTGLISLCAVVFACRDSLFSGRMAHSYLEGSYSYLVFGTKVAISSNLIAAYASISAFISLSRYYKERKRIYLAALAFLAAGVTLTGSRKGILMLCFMLVVTFVLYGKFNWLVKLLGLCIGVVAVYFALTHIAAFRNVIGERLETLVCNLLGLSDTMDSSMRTRALYQNRGLAYVSRYPVFGIGVGVFSALEGNVTENNYLEILVSGGILGFFIYYSYLLPALRFIRVNLKKIRVKNWRNDCCEYVFLFVLIMVIQYGSVIYYTRTYMIYMMLFYAVITIYRNRKAA